jgi:hypothetical protein
MPQTPAWYSRVNEIATELAASPQPYVDRATVERLLRVGPRRAQQILAALPSATTMGSSTVVGRNELLAHLQRLANGDDIDLERRRRQKLAAALLDPGRATSPVILEQAPEPQPLGELEGVHLEPGRLTVEFSSPKQALERLFALATAIQGDFEGFMASSARSNT